MTTSIPISLEPGVLSILADPVSKQPTHPTSFRFVKGIPDARVFLKNTHGYSTWVEGQNYYESDTAHEERPVESYRAEIEYDRPTYDHFHLNGTILDSGGGVGTVREFLPETVKFVSIDPYINAPDEIPPARLQAYTCLSRPLNFIFATAEFLPFASDSFDWVHMRSMLDHVQVPDLALLEATRVLKPNGRVLIGLYVEGGRSGMFPLTDRMKEVVKAGLQLIGVERWKDHHIWHPTYKAVMKLVTDNRLAVDDVYWQPHFHDTVCYLSARKV